LQRSANAALDSTELSRITSFVNATTAKGAYVILEPHNFARYYPDPNNFQESAKGLVGSDVPYSVFSNFWNRVATVFKTNDHVFFNLVNEPAAMPTEQWLTAANTAIQGIRNAGATNLIMVPGNAYTAAGSWIYDWYGTPNSEVMLNVVDPANNYVYELHNYFDAGGGTTADIKSVTVGVDRLAPVTQWLKAHNKRGFLGEFAVAASTIGAGIGDEAVTNMLTHINNNADVWLGWTWWAAGPSYTGYMFSLEPIGGDRPQMSVLTNFIPNFAVSTPVPAPTLEVLAGNKVRFTAQPGFVYQVQTSANLVGGPWTDFGSPITGTNRFVTNSLPVGSGEQGAMRVRVSRAP
jgi:endoglucanase